MKAKYLIAALSTAGAFVYAIPSVGLAAPGSPYAPIKALSTVQPGLWDIRSRDNPDANRVFCLSDVKILVQLRHPNSMCPRFVISDTQREATVQYSCPSRGNGRTTIRVETPRLVQIETQGIADQSPFAFSAEARRAGDCAASSPGVASRKISKPRLGMH